MKTAKELKVGDVIYKLGMPLVRAVTITKEPVPQTDYDGKEGFLINEFHWLPNETWSESLTLFTTFEQAQEATILYFTYCLNAAKDQTEPETESLSF